MLNFNRNAEVFDSNDFCYSDAEWEQLSRLLPNGSCEVRLRKDVESAATLVIKGYDLSRPTNKVMIDRWHRVVKAAEELRIALHGVLDEDEGGTQFNGMCSRLLFEADQCVRMYERSPTRRRSENEPGLVMIVDAILDLWTKCGGKLRYSMGLGERPGGPLIRFLVTALAPMHSAGLKPQTEFQLAYIIRKKRKRPHAVGEGEF